MQKLKFTPHLDCIPYIIPFFEKMTNTFSYIVKDPQSAHCAVIDSVMDLDYAAGSISYTSVNQIIQKIQKEQWTLDWIIDTHVHADHLSAASYIQDKLGGQIGIGAKVVQVQQTFAEIFNENNTFLRDGSQFDYLFEEGDTYSIGHLEAQILHTPGHTPACMTHIIGNAAFVGDTLFMPDSGTARADFPGGDATTLYQSIHKIFLLPDEMRLFMCHDYAPNGREIKNHTTVGEEKKHNIHVGNNINQSDFVKMREARDKTLSMPKLILPALQVNIRAGQLPPAQKNHQHYFNIPINAFNNKN